MVIILMDRETWFSGIIERRYPSRGGSRGAKKERGGGNPHPGVFQNKVGKIESALISLGGGESGRRTGVCVT